MQASSYRTPTTPAVIFWDTTAPEAEADPEMILEGEASVPEYTEAATLCVLIVSPAPSIEVKSKG